MDNHSYMDPNEFCIRDESLLGLKGFKELKCRVAGAEEKLSAVAWGWVLFPPTHGEMEQEAMPRSCGVRDSREAVSGLL